MSRYKKPLMVFAPIMRTNRMHMPIQPTQRLQWDYFKWHYALIDLFESRRDYFFIWKALPARFQKDTITLLLRDKKNIKYDTGSLVNYWYERADRVLCDVPSMAFMECVMIGIPVLALYNPFAEKVMSDYGASLQPYTSIEEGLRLVNRFLDSGPQEYIAQRAGWLKEREEVKSNEKTLKSRRD